VFSVKSRTQGAAPAQAAPPSSFVYAQAVAQGNLAFGPVADALFPAGRRETSGSGDDPERVAQLRAAFEARHGAIVALECWAHIRAAAALTGSSEIHVQHPLPGLVAPEFAELAWRCDHLGMLTSRFLRQRDQERCATKTFGVLRGVLDLAEHSPPAGPQLTEPLETPGPSKRPEPPHDHVTSERLKVLNDEYNLIKHLYEAFAQRKARQDYFKGVGVGALLLIAVVGLGRLLGARDDPLGALLAGGGGALGSIISQATFGRVYRDRVAGGTWLTLTGLFRPVIGAIFGIVFYGLIRSSLLPVKPPSDPTAALAFYCTIAFVAGFSHRWAQDTISAASHRLGGSADPESATPVGERPASTPGG
jgi:hypothetical protein